jgi:hypothetical protein
MMASTLSCTPAGEREGQVAIIMKTRSSPPGSTATLPCTASPMVKRKPTALSESGSGSGSVAVKPGWVRRPRVSRSANCVGVATAGATCSTTWAPLARLRRMSGMTSPSGVRSSRVSSCQSPEGRESWKPSSSST